MQLALAIAVALLAVGVVAWPLVARGRWNRGASATGLESDGADRAALETVYEAIRTLQTEHSLGRVTDADFQEQLNEYRRQAALILRDMEREKGETRDG